LVFKGGLGWERVGDRTAGGRREGGGGGRAGGGGGGGTQTSRPRIYSWSGTVSYQMRANPSLRLFSLPPAPAAPPPAPRPSCSSFSDLQLHTTCTCARELTKGRHMANRAASSGSVALIRLPHRTTHATNASYSYSVSSSVYSR